MVAQTYFASLAGHIQDYGGLVVFNPGSRISCSLAKLADVYVRYENSAADFALTGR